MDIEATPIIRQIASLANKYSSIDPNFSVKSIQSQSLLEDFFRLAEYSKQLMEFYNLNAPKKDPRDTLQMARLRMENKILREELKKMYPSEQSFEDFQRNFLEVDLHSSKLREMENRVSLLTQQLEEVTSKEKSTVLHLESIKKNTQESFEIWTGGEVELSPCATKLYKTSHLSLRSINESQVFIDSFSDVEIEQAIQREIKPMEIVVKKHSLILTSPEYVYIGPLKTENSTQYIQTDTSFMLCSNIVEFLNTIDIEPYHQETTLIIEDFGTICIPKEMPKLSVDSFNLQISQEKKQPVFNIDSFYLEIIQKKLLNELSIETQGNCYIELFKEKKLKNKILETQSLKGINIIHNPGLPRNLTVFHDDISIPAIKKVLKLEKLNSLMISPRLRPIEIENFNPISVTRQMNLRVQFLRTINIESPYPQFTDDDDARSDFSVSERRRRRQGVRKTAIEEYFALTFQAIKLNMPQKDKLPHISIDSLYKQTQREEIPFNLWYNWLSEKLHQMLPP